MKWFAPVFLLICGLFWLGVTAEADLGAVLAPPSWSHWFGTDLLGRDVFIRVLQGNFLSWMIGLIAASVAVMIGVILGFWAGFRQGWLDFIVMRVLEVFSSVPQLVFVTLLAVVFRPWAEASSASRLLFLALSIALVHWVNFARLTRTTVLQLSREPFVEGARAIGAGFWRILWVHLRPHLAPVLRRAYLASLPSFLLFESFLSFLGFGLQPPDVSLGTLLDEGWKNFSISPHLLLAPGLVLFAQLLYFQLVFSKSPTSRREDLA